MILHTLFLLLSLSLLFSPALAALNVTLEGQPRALANTTVHWNRQPDDPTTFFIIKVKVDEGHPSKSHPIRVDVPDPSTVTGVTIIPFIHAGVFNLIVNGPDGKLLHKSQLFGVNAPDLPNGANESATSVGAPAPSVATITGSQMSSQNSHGQDGNGSGGNGGDGDNDNKGGHGQSDNDHSGSGMSKESAILGAVITLTLLIAIIAVFYFVIRFRQRDASSSFRTGKVPGARWSRVKRWFSVRLNRDRTQKVDLVPTPYSGWRDGHDLEKSPSSAFGGSMTMPMFTTANAAANPGDAGLSPVRRAGQQAMAYPFASTTNAFGNNGSYSPAPPSYAYQGPMPRSDSRFTLSSGSSETSYGHVLPPSQQVLSAGGRRIPSSFSLSTVSSGSTVSMIRSDTTDNFSSISRLKPLRPRTERQIAIDDKVGEIEFRLDELKHGLGSDADSVIRDLETGKLRVKVERLKAVREGSWAHGQSNEVPVEMRD